MDVDPAGEHATSSTAIAAIATRRPLTPVAPPQCPTVTAPRMRTATLPPQPAHTLTCAEASNDRSRKNTGRRGRSTDTNT